MFLFQRLRQFIGCQVEVMTAAGLTEGTLISVTPVTIVVQVAVDPGYPPVTVTINIFAISFIRITSC
ncbi:DUF2642 domain-containing protein [Desmospora profundinema]|uniref:Uncharacterized protein n=1 Tax=Desmospora profundinema TaxID=1571184 RepID=A0ABU1IHU3_9BACL|nr:DUF2642 domain-containing protein [Desmospora profundinema]MDR6224338.1 hypothetical protein [Desmospora profundinema]